MTPGVSGPKRLLVVSDFHLASGRDPRTGRYSLTEDFFWDEEFADFLSHYGKNGGWTLIVNGDLFDFIQIMVFPDEQERQSFGIPKGDIDKVYGPRTTEAASAFQAVKAIEGHPKLFEGLLDFLLKGNEVKILKGNHDVHLFWSKVQVQIFYRLEEKCPESQRHLVRERLEFLPWCYYIPDLMFIEHGNQYEDTCSFSNFLYPKLPFDYEGTSNHIELDLSSFLIRYWSNRAEPVNPLADNVRPTTKFVSWFWKNHPLLFIRIAKYGLRFILKAFSKARGLRSGHKRRAGALQAITDRNRELIREQAEKFAGDQRKEFVEQVFRKFVDIDSKKAEPVLPKGAWNFLKILLQPFVRSVPWVLPLLLVWYLGELLKFLLCPFGSFIGKVAVDIDHYLDTHPVLHIGFLILVTFLLILRRISVGGKGSGKDLLSGSSMEMRGIAERISKTLNVKYVSFGHTHYPDIHPLNNGGWYYNTGCWMSVIAEEEQLYREPQQFTFLKVEDEKAALLRWEPSRREPASIVVMESMITPGEEEGISKLLWKTLSTLLSGRIR